jgi:hypothetical protein
VAVASRGELVAAVDAGEVAEDAGVQEIAGEVFFAQVLDRRAVVGVLLELFEFGLGLFEFGLEGGELAGRYALQVQGEGVVLAGDGVVGFALLPFLCAWVEVGAGLGEGAAHGHRRGAMADELAVEADFSLQLDEVAGQAGG